MPTIEITEFVTLEAIPVAETGIDYPASTGPISLTSSMFSEAVRYTEDPHGMNPRIKISHGANPIDQELQSLFDAYNQDRDASLPSLGTILNLREDNNGQTLVGDWYGLPSWLAAILETAYPARSIEGGAWFNEANQKNYDFKIDAVALLGVIGPGCTSLADLQELFSKDGPQIQVIEMSRPKTTTPIKMGGSSTMPAALQVNVEDIRRSFYEEFATGDRYWWWDRELLADPWEFIVSDLDSGQLYRVPFTPEEDANGDTVVSEWGEPDPIKIQYVPDPSAVAAGVKAAVRSLAPQLERTGVLLAVNSSSPREDEHKQKEKPSMGIDIPSLRSRLKLSAEDLPDDATEEQINAALVGDPEEEPETPESEETPPNPELEASGRTVDDETWKQVQADAAAGRKARQEQVEAHRKSVVEAAITDRKIPPGRREHYLSMHEKDPKGTEDFLAKLEKNAVPGPELGSAAAGDGDATTRGLGTGLLPELAAKEA